MIRRHRYAMVLIVAIAVWSVVATVRQTHGDQVGGETAVVLPPGLGRGVDWHVAVDGSATGAGTIEDPWSLHSALTNPDVRSGDTIWVHGGRYLAPYGYFDPEDEERVLYFFSTLAGTADAPIGVRARPGERVTLVGNSALHTAGGAEDTVSEPAVLTVGGAHTVFWGLELTLSRRDRTERSTNADCRGGSGRIGSGVSVEGDDIRLVNLVLHDTAQGVALLQAATNAELYGSLIFYNGRFCEHDDEPVGHGVYGQTHPDSAVEHGRRVLDNIVFDNFEYQLHFYTSGGAELTGLLIEGNTLFTTGMAALHRGEAIRRVGPRANILVGSPSALVDDVIVRNNVTYYPLSLPDGAPLPGGRNIEMGWGSGPGCRDSHVVGNYSVGGSAVVLHASCESLAPSVRDNVFVSVSDIVSQYEDNEVIDYGTDPLPVENVVRVEPNVYEPGRANITVLNWEKRDRVEVDLDEVGLRDGQAFEVRDAQNFFGPPVASGAYDRGDGATVEVPITGLEKVQLRGVGLRQDVPHTAPGLAVFVIVPR